MHRHANKQHWLDTAISWLIVLTYFLYPTVSSTFFQAFSCETIVLGNQRSEGALPLATSRWLHRDYALNCDSAKHKYYESWAQAMILMFAFGVPVILWALLFRHRHNLSGADAQYLAFLFGDFRFVH